MLTAQIERFVLRRAVTLLVACLASESAFKAWSADISVPPSPPPSSVAAGDILNLFNGGSLPDGFVAQSGSQLNVFGGWVGGSSGLAPGSQTNVFGGAFGPATGVQGEVNLYDGNLGEFIEFDGGVINMYGGTIGQGFTNFGVFNQFGGALHPGFLGIGGPNASYPQGSVFNLFGSDFRFDGVPIDGLVPGVEFEVTQRGGVLTGILLDGMPFTYPLILNAPGDTITQGELALGTRFTITTLVPTPAAGTLAAIACGCCAPLLQLRRRLARRI